MGERREFASPPDPPSEFSEGESMASPKSPADFWGSSMDEVGQPDDAPVPIEAEGISSVALGEPDSESAAEQATGVSGTGAEAGDEIAASGLSEYRRRFSFPESRYVALTEAIARYPNAPSNYVLRGELLLEVGEHGAAAQDFEAALALAEKNAESADWGYITMALMERARSGLRRCKY